MSREFHIFTNPSASPVAVKNGFCWPGFFLTWIWAFARGLWLPGSFLLVINAAVLSFVFFGFEGSQVVSILLGLGAQVAVGLKGNVWRIKKLEQSGFGFVGVVSAGSVSEAIGVFARGGDLRRVVNHEGSSLFSLPGGFQRVFAIALLTWKAAFRFRLFIVIAVLLLAAVVGLPILIKDDGTARGFTQILLTYTLSAITGLLGLSTLWLSCGTLARDIEECQLQMVAVKPISRWQIWVGKWLGIMSLNAALLAISGFGVFALLQWRATKLPEQEQHVLRNEVLVARGSAKEASVENELEAETNTRMQAAIEKAGEKNLDLKELKQQIKEGLKAEMQVVPPRYTRPWQIDLGVAHHFLKDRPLYLRVKFNAAEKSPSGTFLALWQVGVPKKTQLWQTDAPMSLAPDTFHEFEIPPNLFDADGKLTILFMNPNNTAILFPLEDGMEVLYREGGFGLNFARGLGIIFCWMALLASLGLAAASFLSFPVAAFVSLAALIVTFSTGTLASAVEQGTVMGQDEETGQTGHSVVDLAVIPAFKAILGVVGFAKDFSPVEALSSGRSITWNELGMAFAKIVLFLGGVLAVIGIWALERRELATAQNQS
ncbi:MAG: DUF2628 domain-containing protein [Verrucomicrobia bacterium]|nr:DUF2628 domain-containing protein [Verrucomicrobiota bacterium]